MTESWGLQAQVAIALADLDIADAVLRAAEDDVPLGLLSTLRTRVNGQRRDLRELTGPDAPSPAAGWRRLAQGMSLSQQIFREVLAILGGSLLRRDGYDGGICQVADALVREIITRANRTVDRQVHWDGTTMVDVSESYTHLGGTIRLRFPELNVWALPIVAHEVGHLLVGNVAVWDQQRNRHISPLFALIAGDDAERAPDARTGELLADIVATMSVGLPYACSAVLLRFNPAHAEENYRAHPPARDRAYVILQALRALGPEHAWSADRVQGLWAAALQTAGAAELPDAQTDELDTLVKLGEETIATHLTDLRYAGLGRALALEDHLSHGAALAGPLGETDLSDVLTAAWRVRLAALTNAVAFDLDAVSNRAAALCATVAFGAGDV